MDFAVPDAGGVGPSNPALLAARGADPLIVIPAAPHFFRRVRGITLLPVPGALAPVANTLQCSWVEAILCQALRFDAVAAAPVGALAAPLVGVLPAAFERVLNRLLTDGLDAAAVFASPEAAYVEVANVIASLDPSNIDVAYTLQVADVFKRKLMKKFRKVTYNSVKIF